MKPAVVLLHSSMSSKSQWSSLKAQLADAYRCIPVDLQGYGASPFPADAGDDYVHTLAHEVDAVVAAIASELEPGEAFHLIGHSFGGACALHMARRMPQRVLSLTLFEPVAFHLLPETHPAKAEIVDVVGRITSSASDRDATRIFIDYWNRAGAFDDAPHAAQEKMVAQIAKVKLDFQALLGEQATLDDLSMLTMPALVMAGERSPASTRLLVEQLGVSLPSATASKLRTAHMGPITHGDIVNPAIAGFLSGAEVAAEQQ
ncbi:MULTISPECIES: alpha/beta fold hydrolase [unclassified Duganella]|jgi:pimeloyl-ACP methyl ester carboxylesterase|uniref:alpha/beta fold hydrolase n=1 Tax=unclassified Duganella TaxID=2636909 RepID=UPI00087E26E7|nr:MULTISPECIES: alpha/beta hydrolase [unclassified Duganella]SDH07979.1 Pimeloyl-ACP methyl ester carboxylesterase [Duganella sp. OV458]SDK18218.1 Pimeloyl-ACP methyl ester carboxylesterase [Duganella sp. OV510]